MIELSAVTVALNEGNAVHWALGFPPVTAIDVPASGTKAFPLLARTTLKLTGESDWPGELNVHSHGPTGSTDLLIGARPPQPTRDALERTATSKRHIAGKVHHAAICLNISYADSGEKYSQDTSSEATKPSFRLRGSA